MRLAEFGSCHRNEPSGSLHGIMRVRSFTQDDAHIFCTEEQIQPEVSQFIDFLHEVYADFGFDEIIYRLSTRPQSEWVPMKIGIVPKRPWAQASGCQRITLAGAARRGRLLRSQD